MPAGRPPLYDNVEDMQVIIDKYFEEEEIHTMAGLGYALGMCRQSLLNYSNKDEFLDTIKKARNKVEVYAEKCLYGNNVAGPIFNLKNNFEWKDKTERQYSGSVGLHQESTEELLRILRAEDTKLEQSTKDG